MSNEIIIKKRNESKLNEVTLIEDETLQSITSAEEIANQKAERKLKRRQELEENSMSYALARSTAKYLDGWFLDPILGFFMPGVGDAITSALTLPMIYLALVKLRSLPLTLALVNNLMKDALLGMIPFFIGDFIDIFYKANKRNYRLINGYIDEDPETIKEVNRGAIWAAISIAIIIFLMYWMFQLIAYLAGIISDFFSNLYNMVFG